MNKQKGNTETKGKHFTEVKYLKIYQEEEEKKRMKERQKEKKDRN